MNRLGLSVNYIKGEGIEIGALNLPMFVRPGVKVRYVDRISAEEHAKIFPDMPLKSMVHVDIIDNGETLQTVGAATQDFVIANHFIEHCQNPAMTIENLLRVLKKGGVLFMAIPDKRYTFDIDRDLTDMEHFIRDYREGPAWSEESHYQDFVRKTEWSKNAKNDEDIAKTIQHLKDINFSIHFHVWSHPTMIDFFQMLRKELRFPFEIEMTMAPLPGSNEGIFILKKL
ncbi:MAG: methyltransferase domain-containing protein [Bacteroidetes bacterium]|nr:methyltransferase domain-containing protein [Bacteroidota bacterium]